MQVQPTKLLLLTIILFTVTLNQSDCQLKTTHTEPPAPAPAPAPAPPSQLKHAHSNTHQDSPHPNINLITSFTRFLSAANPLWTVSFRFFKISFRWIFRFLYSPLYLLCIFLNRCILTIWDQIILPITFPVRLASWILIVKPLSILQAVLEKLKPLIIFMFSGLTMGVIIGALASHGHLFIADRLFPLHGPAARPAKARQGVDGPKRAADRPAIRSRDARPTGEHSDDAAKGAGRGRDGVRETDPESESSPSSFEDEAAPKDADDDELDWAPEDLGPRLPPAEASHRLGYSSAIQSILANRTRKRAAASRSSVSHHPRISSLHQTPLSPQNYKFRSRSPPHKKKVTFKTD